MPSFKTENALLLSAKPLGERSWLLSVLTPENGRFCGVLKTKQPPHVGSFLSLRWQARLNEQLGTFYLDDAKAFFIDFPACLISVLKLESSFSVELIRIAAFLFVLSCSVSGR